MKIDFFRQFSKKSQISYFIKIRSVGADLADADGQTDMTQLTVAFRSFANAPHNLQAQTFPGCSSCFQ
jgi:hypothetical protein